MPYLDKLIASLRIENRRYLFKCIGIVRALDTECMKACTVHNKADICLHGIHSQVPKHGLDLNLVGYANRKRAAARAAPAGAIR
jgi:hypothetical protein